MLAVIHFQARASISPLIFMPLSEFHQRKGKIETEQPKMTNYSSGRSLVMPDQDFVELLWENGPIVMQGQSSRPKKSTLTTLSPYASKFQGKDSTDAVIPKIGHFGEMDSNDFAPSVPSAPFGMNAQADDANPWMDYPIDDHLQNDYCSDFLSEFTSVHLNSHSLNSTTVPADRSNGFGHSVRNSENASEARVRTGQLFQLPHQCHSSAPTTKSRTVEFGTSTLKSPSRNLLERSPLKLDPEASKTLPPPPPPSSGVGLINFSHFSRPFARVRSNLQSSDRVRSQEKASTAASSNPMESTRINSSSGVKSSSVVQGQTASVLTKMDVRPSAKSPPELVTGDIHQEEISRDKYNDNVANVTTQVPYPANCHSSSVIASVTLARNEADNGPEAAVAASSVCSVNSVGEESNDPKHMLKRKNRDGEESGYHSEDLEDESVGLKKPSTARTMNAKRSRAAEVHNMSERRRRDRINEKMRALQELIPNCNKVDKASMLDEAIEYLKTLQLQVQIMSMGNGLCMPQMMLPPGMQHLHPPPMAHFPPMGMNMGMGIGMGYGMGPLDMNASPGCSMIPMPPMHGPQFPCHSIPLARPVVHGLHQPVSTNLQMYGMPGQGLPVSMARALSYGNGNLMPATIPRPVVDTAPASDSKDLEQHNI